jgi:FlgD Ig-like domain
LILKKQIFIQITILVLIFNSLAAIDSIPAHNTLTTPALRDSIISFHNFSDDQHWYGSNSWAVRFDFRAFHTGITNFNTEGVMIYIPGSQSTDPLEVLVCSDLGTQPDLEDGVRFTEVIQAANINFNQWEVFDFQSTITDSILWIVVNYPTNSTDQQIGASAVDGTHSYFLNDGYYDNMLASGFESEFLFSFFGSFVVNDVDLDLVDFHWNGELLPGERIYPIYTIRNTSDSLAFNVYITSNLLTPDGTIDLKYEQSGTVCDSILLPDILPHQMVTLDFTDNLYHDIPQIGSQYSYSTTVNCTLDVFSFNNSFSSKFQHFTERQNFMLIENALTMNENSSNNLLQVQSALLESEFVEIINYYPGYTQVPFYCEDSFLRFNFYDLIGTPATLVNGNRRIVGYNASQYTSQFIEKFEEASLNDSTFVSSTTIYGTYDQNGVITVQYNLNNDNNKVFPSYLSNCATYGALVENVVNYGSLPADVEVPILRLIGSQTSGPTLGYGQTFVDTIKFNFLEDLDLITGDVNNCSIVCWLQNDESKRVYDVTSIPFSSLELVDVEPNEIEANGLTFSLFPNPYSYQGNLQINFSTKQPVQKARLKIYNIRGQLVKELFQEESSTNHTFLWNGKDTYNKDVASGVYLMKLITENNGKRSSQHKKCLLLKK